eukprot:158893_1
MGNKQTRARTNYTDYNDPEQPFFDLPQLWGPLNGYYYHIKDKHLAIDNDKNNTNHKIPFIFFYNAVDYENIIKDEPNKNSDINNINYENKEENNESENEIDASTLKEYQQYRFEWVYITCNDNVSYHKMNDSSYLNSLLPDQYQQIRTYLAKKDPIPPHFLRRARMAGMVFQGVQESSLRDINELSCRVITKRINNKNVINIDHPALLIWKRSEEFGEYNDRAFYIIHLRKLPKEYQSDDEKKQNLDQIEIECKPILRHNLDKDEWNYKNYKDQNLTLKNGLIDIAHWCLKYEME